MGSDRFRVVINHEEQYSLWPADRSLPLGWNATRGSGTREQCMAFIEEVWTDLRPLELRRRVEENTRRLESGHWSRG